MTFDYNIQKLLEVEVELVDFQKPCLILNVHNLNRVQRASIFSFSFFKARIWEYAQGHFTLWPKVERPSISTNQIA